MVLGFLVLVTQAVLEGQSGVSHHHGLVPLEDTEGWGRDSKEVIVSLAHSVHAIDVVDVGEFLDGVEAVTS